jgi:hypothetical protein
MSVRFHVASLNLPATESKTSNFLTDSGKLCNTNFNGTLRPYPQTVISEQIWRSQLARFTFRCESPPPPPLKKTRQSVVSSMEAAGLTATTARSPLLHANMCLRCTVSLPTPIHFVCEVFSVFNSKQLQQHCTALTHRVGRTFHKH